MQSAPLFVEPSTYRDTTGAEHTVTVDDAPLEGTLIVPAGARALVALVHASSAGRFAVHHRFVGDVLGQAGLATFQVDLLTPAEEAASSLASYPNQDSSELAARVFGVVDWLKNQAATSRLKLGILASATEIVAALMAAERVPEVGAVVSLGPCPDSLGDRLAQLSVPTLFIVGANEQARAAELASEFFSRHLLAR